MITCGEISPYGMVTAEVQPPRMVWIDYGR